MFRSFAFCVSTLALASSSALSQQPLSPDSLQHCVADVAQRQNFSGVISISGAGAPIVLARGQMAGAGSAAMRTDAQFNIGSAGKMWTAVAVGQLVDAGRISFDDPIGRHVGGLTPEAAAITVRQLLTHSGGLGSFFAPENIAAIEQARSLADLKPLIAQERPAFTSGSRAQYSNSGFLLLGLMIEQVSGQSYENYLRQHVFAPAGMTRSGMWPEPAGSRAVGMTNVPAMGPDDAGPPPPGARILPPPASRDDPPPPGARMGPPPGPGGGPMRQPPGPLRPSDEAVLMGTSAGGGFSTAADMQHFFGALLAGRLTSAAMLQSLTSQQILLLPARERLPAVYYGLGFAVGDVGGQAWTGHGGGAPGLNVATAAFPAQQIVAVVMSNRDPPAADMLMREMQPMLLRGGCAA